MSETLLRIGEVSRRTGVSPELLRAWERRYGLLRPTRSSGGLRLYSSADVERVQRMRRHLDDGLAAAEAAALAAADDPVPVATAPLLPADPWRPLAAALDAFDEPRAQTALDELLAVLSMDALLSDVVLPYLRDLGERWERGEVRVAQEHFASTVLRGRLLGLGRGWGRGSGPLALLACPPGEQHELGLIAFGLALRARGWRIVYLGADTPLETVEAAADSLAPARVVIGTTDADRVRAIAAELRRLAERHPVAVGGAGAAGVDARGLGVLRLADDPVAAAESLARAPTAQPASAASTSSP